VSKPRVLLTNDDGVRSPGLLRAYEALSEVADVTVVAPADQRSGHSHMLTLDTPLRAKQLKDLPGYKVDFTPVDCVKLALKQLLPEPPDMIVSGINWGFNAGNLVHYSGTVAAAIEGVLNGVPSLAVSLCCYKRKPDFGPAARVTRLLVEKLLAEPLPANTLLNVNVPVDAIKGFRWTRQSMRVLDDEYEAREDPRGRTYYWLTGSIGELRGLDAKDDLEVVHDGYVALTPLTVDWTHEGLMKSHGEGSQWLEELGGAL
jgi:5'-nucleotidase